MHIHATIALLAVLSGGVALATPPGFPPDPPPFPIPLPPDLPQQPPQMPGGWDPMDPPGWLFPDGVFLPPLGQNVHEVPGEYDTIQEAIDAADDGHTVEVAQGTYYENLEIDGKGIRLVGDGAVTLRPADDAPILVVSDTPQDSVVELEGLTFTSIIVLPMYNPMSGEWYTVEIVPDFGIGLVASGAYVQIEECTFTMLANNWGMTPFFSFPGAGIISLESVVTVASSTFDDCRAFDGGAVVGYASIMYIEYSDFNDNQSDGDGAAVRWHECMGGILGCTFQGNAAYSHGGAIRMEGGYYSVSRSAFVDNSAAWGGAGSSAVSDDLDADPSISQCRFMGNSAGETGDMWFGDTDSFPSITQCGVCGHADDDAAGFLLSYEINSVFADCEYCPGDATSDQVIDTDDILDVMTVFGTADPLADVNGDDDVNVEDLLHTLELYGECQGNWWENIDWPDFPDPPF